MTFAAPLFLLAALAGVIPVIVHLIHRRRAKEIRFSTLRFLRVSVQRTRRRKYVEDLSLLLVRVAALLLIAAGLAQPAVSGLAALWGGGRTAAIALVLDNSASMAVIDGGRTRFEAARQAAAQVLDRLREGDQVALLPTGGPPGPELGRLVRAHETVRQALEQCRPSSERADLAARLHQARELLAASDAAAREIYVMTDNQLLSWEGLKETPDADGGASVHPEAEPPVIVVQVGGDPAPNLALQALSLESPAPVAGARFQVAAEVRNTSSVAQQRHLELQLDGVREATSPTLSIPPDGTVKYEFRFAPRSEGVHRGEVRLVEDDGSPLDNQLHFAVAVDPRLAATIVKPRRDEVPQADDAFYLERALAPGGSVGAAFRISTQTPETLAGADLSGQAIVFCVNLPALTPPTAEKLLDYVRGGGHVVWVCGRNVQPVAYNAMNALAQGQLLPAPLEDLRQPPPGGDGGWRLAFLDKDDPALAPLTTPAALYQSVLVYQYFPMTLNPQTPARVLIKLDDGQPLLAERSLGGGSVLLLGTSLHVDWTNLPLRPLFLPLLARLSFRLAGVENERTMTIAGAPVTLPLGRGKDRGADPAAPREVEVVRPSSEVVRLPSPPEAAGPRAFTYADTHEPGVYLVRLLDRRPPRQLAFAVNVDPAEADPATLTRAELQARFGPRPLLFCESPDALPGMIDRMRKGISLREWFLAAVLLGLVLEVFLANRGSAAGAGALEPGAAAVTPASTADTVAAVASADGPPAAAAAPAAVAPADDVRSFLEGLQRGAAAAEREPD